MLDIMYYYIIIKYSNFTQKRYHEHNLRHIVFVSSTTKVQFHNRNDSKMWMRSTMMIIN